MPTRRRRLGLWLAWLAAALAVAVGVVAVTDGRRQRARPRPARQRGGPQRRAEERPAETGPDAEPGRADDRGRVRRDRGRAARARSPSALDARPAAPRLADGQLRDRARRRRRRGVLPTGAARSRSRSSATAGARRWRRSSRTRSRTTDAHPIMGSLRRFARRTCLTTCDPGPRPHRRRDADALARPRRSVDSPDQAAGAAQNTVLTLNVRSCEGCEITLVQLPRRRHGGGWASDPHTVQNGKAAFVVPTAKTEGISVMVRTPWEGQTGYVHDGRLPLQGSRHGRADRLQQGPHDEEGQRLLGRHDREAGQPAVQGPPRQRPGRRTARCRATSPGPRRRQAWLPPMLPVYGGVLGAQDVIACQPDRRRGGTKSRHRPRHGLADLSRGSRRSLRDLLDQRQSGDPMGKQEDFVLRALEERDVRFVRLWFTDVLGFLKSVAVAPAELEGAFDEGIGFDGSADRGLRPGLRGRHAGQARPGDVPDPAVARRGPVDGPDVLRHRDARRLPVVRRPALRAQAHAGQGRRQGLHLLHPPRDRVLPLQGHPAAGRRAGAGRPQRLLRPHRAVDGRRLPPRGDHDAGVDGHLGGVQPPRGRPRPAGDRPALRRRAQHRRQHHDLPHGDPGGGAEPGHLGVVHAQAVHHPPRLRRCTPTSRSSRATATPSSRPAPSTSCPRPAASSSPASSARQRDQRASPTSGSTATSG